MSPGVPFAADEIDITKAARNIHNGCFIGLDGNCQCGLKQHYACKLGMTPIGHGTLPI
jgi:hypothetical protein